MIDRKSFTRRAVVVGVALLGAAATVALTTSAAQAETSDEAEEADDRPARARVSG